MYEIDFENVIHWMAAISPQPQCVNLAEFTNSFVELSLAQGI